MTIFTKLQKRSLKSGDGHGMSKEDIRSEIDTFLFAGKLSALNYSFFLSLYDFPFSIK